MSSASVYGVGIGPGDPELLMIKPVKLLGHARRRALRDAPERAIRYFCLYS